MVCIDYMKFVAQPSELKVDETYIKVIEIIKLDKCMRMLEELMDRWPFLINDILLHRNPNDVWEWEKRVALWADNDDKVWFASLVQSLLLNRLNEGGRNIHKVNRNHHSLKGHTKLP